MRVLIFNRYLLNQYMSKEVRVLVVKTKSLISKQDLGSARALYQVVKLTVIWLTCGLYSVATIDRILGKCETRKPQSSSG